MIRTVSQIKGELADREAIKDCLYRYSRGIDRCDTELLRSAYWPGAMDTHTGFKGTIEEFIAWAEPRLQAMEQNMHMIGNILLRLDGNKASGEAYFWSVAVISGDVPRAYSLVAVTWIVLSGAMMNDGLRSGSSPTIGFPKPRRRETGRSARLGLPGSSAARAWRRIKAIPG
jgi:hypothetical protein